MRIEPFIIAGALFATALPAHAQLIQIDCAETNLEERIAKENPSLPRKMIGDLIKGVCPNGTGPAVAPPLPQSIPWQSADCFPREGLAARIAKSSIPDKLVTPALTANIVAACAKLAEPVPVDPQRSHVGAVETSALLPGGRFAISGGADKTVRVWDLQSDTAPRTIHTAPGSILRLAVSPDGSRAVVSGFDYRPTVIDIATGKVVATLEGKQKFAGAAIFFPDGVLILASASDNEVGIFDAATGKLMRKFPPFLHGIDVLAVSPDGRVAAAGAANDLRVFLVETGQNAMVGQQQSISTLVFEPGGNRFVIGAREKFDIYDMSTGKFAPALSFSPNSGQRGVGAVFLPERNRLLTCSRDLREWDIANRRLVRIIASVPFQCTALSLSADGKTALMSHDDSDIHVIEVASGRLIRSLGQAGPRNTRLEIPLR